MEKLLQGSILPLMGVPVWEHSGDTPLFHTGEPFFLKARRLSPCKDVSRDGALGGGEKFTRPCGPLLFLQTPPRWEMGFLPQIGGPPLKKPGFF